MRKLLALIEAPRHVCYRYRVEAFESDLLKSGWTLQAQPLASSPFARSRQLREAAAADVVLLQRKLLPLWQLRVLRQAAKRLVYDFDDAVFTRDSYSRKKPSSWTRLAHFWATIYAADGVFAGNDYLREQAACYIEPENVHLLPTCVEPDRYRLAVHERRENVRLAWIGQKSTLPSVYQAESSLAAAASRAPGLQLWCISDEFPELNGIAITPRKWAAATEVSDLAAADIGISWLPDDPWSLGKCGLKVLQYMAAGLPVVANPVGMNREMVRDGRTGFLASTPEEWAAAISRLASDPELRAKMGAAGREAVQQRFSVEHWAPSFVAALDSIAAAPPSSAVQRGPHYSVGVKA